MNLRGIGAFVILLATLAFSHRFLGHSNDPGIQEQQDLRTVQGYYLTNAILKQRDALGKPLYDLRADRIEQLPNHDRIRLTTVKVNYPGNEAGKGWDLSANEGDIIGDGRKIILRHNVHALERGENSMRLIRTSELMFDPVRSIASTDADVIVELDGYRLFATGMVADLKANTVKLESAVNARFEP